jgi:hypothetical protein
MMQNIKDSFYMELRARLAALNPERTAFVGGAVRPAIMITENELADTSRALLDTFYLSWHEAQASGPVDASLLQLACEITYSTEGTESMSYQDRGRMLAQLDGELLSICCPGGASLKDYSVTPSADLAQRIFWTRPEFPAVELSGRLLTHAAKLKVFSFAEVAC